MGRMRPIGRGWRDRERALEEAGAAGIITSRWSGGWGVNKIFDAGTQRVPAIDISCEDYGMLFRMVEAGQSPRLRVNAEAEDLGEVPQFNIIAELRGTELPDEYVVLSAHLDSWHAGTGATDNGTGTIMMLEARTFSGVDANADDSACGTWFELTLPVRDTVRAARFWAPIAPTLLEMREEPTTHMRFEAGGAVLGLSESIALEGPSLCFKCYDAEALVSVAERAGIPIENYPGFEGAFARIRAPEGTSLFMFKEDFLGEAYEVEEGGDPADFPQA